MAIELELENKRRLEEAREAHWRGEELRQRVSDFTQYLEEMREDPPSGYPLERYIQRLAEDNRLWEESFITSGQLETTLKEAIERYRAAVLGDAPGRTDQEAHQSA